MQVRKQQLVPDMEKQTGSKLGKEFVKAVYCHPAYITYMQSTSCKMPSWMTQQARIKIAAGKISNLRYADDTIVMAESKEELKRLLKVKEESEKAVLKLNIQNTKIMASSPITSWQISGKQWKQWLTLFFWAPKSLQMVTAAMKLKDAYSLEGKL